MCAGTTPTCVGTQWRCAYPSNYEAQEVTCDGHDNDCDGTPDNNLTPPAAFCDSDGVCAGTVPACEGTGGWVCHYTSADWLADEDKCDTQDNDCDTQVDECTGGKQCHASVTVCTDPLDIDFDADTVTERAGDCGPQDAAITPGKDDIVDQKDNDCDHFMDEFTDGEGALITTLRSYQSGTVSPAKEFDYWSYAFTPGTWHVRLVAYPQATADLSVGVFKADGTRIGDMVNAAATGGFEVANVTIPDTATYFLGVTSVGSTTGPYRIAVYPGAYDPSAIAGGDAWSAFASINSGVIVAGGANADTDPFGNAVEGDELFVVLADGSGAVDQVSHFLVPGMLIQDVAISPNRGLIAFTSNWNGGRWDAYVMDLQAERVHRVSPDTLPCPQNTQLYGFAQPAFVSNAQVMFLGECYDIGSGTEIDVVIKAPPDGSAAATFVTLANPNNYPTNGANTCLRWYVHPRPVPGAAEVAISRDGCAFSGSETFTGMMITAYNSTTGAVTRNLNVNYAGEGTARVNDTHHKGSAWDFNSAGTAYAVSTDQGLIIVNASTGAITLTVALGGSAFVRNQSGDYWNREWLDYEDNGSRLVHATWREYSAQHGDGYDLYVFNGSTRTTVYAGGFFRRGVAW